MPYEINYLGLLSTSLNYQLPVAQQMFPVPKLNITIPILGPNGSTLRLKLLSDLWKTSSKSQSSADGSQSSVDGASNDVLNNTNLSGLFGNIFSSGLSTAGNTIFNNVIKGTNLTEGLAKDVGNSVLGTASGLTANLIGQGINKLGGDSMLSRGVGQGIATGLGSVGGTVLSNLINTGKIAGTASKLFGTGNNILTTTKTVKDAAGNITKATQVGAINPYALGASIVGTGLSAAFGPSKEYNGRYGNITKTMDSAYDVIQGAAAFIPGYGQAISGAMALNKGLSNIFGSTDGMTKTDAILGSAFMPAPVKWVNMWGSSKTGNFDNQSWQNIEKANSFMGNAFGDLNDKFELAREEANKRYGTFSQGAKRRALRNIDFANSIWGDVLAMADQNELQNIRSLYMSSINNQRYAQMILGGYNPLAIGKQGMKILNNATNHNMGLRLLSAAALIDNKAMILSAQGGTKITHLRPTPIRRKPATREENPELWDEWERREAEQQAARLQVYDLEQLAAAQRAETNTEHALHYSNLATGIAETAQQNALFEPVTQESLQNSNTERLRRELLADKDEYFDNGMNFINAAGFADLGVIASPLLQRGFRWAFNKAGLLIKVPINKFTTAKSVYNKGNMTPIEVLQATGKGISDVYKTYSPGGAWYQRQLANGVPKEEVDRLASEYLKNLKKTTFEVTDSPLSDAVAVTGGEIRNGEIIPKITMDPKYAPNNLLVRIAASHEGGHASTLNLEPKNSPYREPEHEGFYLLVEKENPEITKAMEYNESLRPDIKNSALDEALLDETGNAERHINNVISSQEIRQRALASEIDASNKGVTMDEYINNPKLWDLNFKQLIEIFNKKGIKNYMLYFKSLTPIIVGGSTAATLYNKSK